jgi:DNA-directed RNA polymerase subunit H
MQRLLDIKRTQVQLVRDRGYNIGSDERYLTMSVSDFNAAYNQQAAATDTPISVRNFISHRYTKDDGQLLLVYYAAKSESSKKYISIDIIKSFTYNINHFRTSDNILIVNAPLSAKSVKEIADYQAQHPNRKIQIYQEHDLTYNPTLHYDVPVHELVPSDQADRLLAELKVTPANMLLIREDDPIIRYYGWSPGNIIRVYRNDISISMLAPRSINYRVVIPA